MTTPVESLEITILVDDGTDACQPIRGSLKPRWPAHRGVG
jgi:hypothetical protein